MKGEGRQIRITRDMVQEAIRLRAEDARQWTYRALAERYGISGRTMYDRMHQHKERMRVKEGASGRINAGFDDRGRPPISDVELRLRLRAIPPDTRNFWQRHFDEPAPGRSALDAKRREMTA